jgi:hypothetical protein
MSQDIEAQLAALEAELRGQTIAEANPASVQFEPEAPGMAAD